MDVFHQSTGDLPQEDCSSLLTLELGAEHFQIHLDAILQMVLPQNQVHPTLSYHLMLPSMIDLHMQPVGMDLIIISFSDDK